MEKFSIEGWHDFGRWIQPTLSASFWVYWHEGKVLKELFPEYRFSQIKYVDGHCLGFNKDQAFCGTKIASAVDKSDFLEKFDKIGNDLEQAHLHLLDESLSPEDYTKKLFSTYQEIVCFWWLAILLGEEIEKFITKNEFASGNQEINEKIASVRRPTWLEQQSEEVSKFARIAKENGLTSFSEIENDVSLSDKIEIHVKKFEWFGTHHWMGEPYDKTKCIEQIVERLNKQPQENSEVQTANDLIWRLTASIVYWRTHCAEMTAKVVYDSRPLLTELASAHNLSYEDLTYLSAEEITTLIGENNSTSATEIAERKDGFGVWLEDGKERIVTGQELQGAIKVIQGDDIATDTIKGMVACRPCETFRGKVKIILSPKDFANFTKGEILVAPETSPDFVPLMQMASAIITEAGGITSHAAIISRELNTPCIIGTKVATRVLKDNMEVEMDLLTGLINVVS